MRELFPDPGDDVDVLERYLGDDRPRPRRRPWVMLNMIASIDGATALDGVSGGLGSPADKEVFRAVRASCDWIVVASATATAERYHSPHHDERAAARRRERGRATPAGLAIVTASGRLDPAIPALADPDPDGGPTLVIAGRDADDAALAATHAEVVRVAGPAPTPTTVLAALAERGADVVLAEGGPTWNGILAQAGVIDEVCLSVAPAVVGGDSPRIVSGAAPHTTAMRLGRLLESDGMLFARYVRA